VRKGWLGADEETMKYAFKLRFAMAAVSAGGLLGVACESEELRDPSSEVAPPSTAAQTEELNPAPLPMSADERAAFERENGQVRCHETPSQSELSIHWEKTPETSRTELTAIVKNNAATTISAEPVLVAVSSALGETRERRLDPVTVAPGAETALAVNVGDFPLQSAGEATQVSIGLRWKRRGLPAEMSNPQALSQPLFVTHDDESFRTAVLREYDSQLRLEAASASRPKATGSEGVGRPLRRALSLANAREFRVIERADVPTLEVAAPVLAETTNIDAREP
jgi:hypothetical protein